MFFTSKQITDFLIGISGYFHLHFVSFIILNCFPRVNSRAQLELFEKNQIHLFNTILIELANFVFGILSIIFVLKATEMLIEVVFNWLPCSI